MSKKTKSLEKKAVERELEKLEESPALNIEQPKNWLLVITVLGLLAVLILWSFFGKIPTEATGRSVSISSEGVFLVESPSTGTLTNLYVSEGDTIVEGTPLAKFNNPKLRSTLTAVEATKFKIERLHSQSLLLQNALSINVGLFKQGLIAKMVIDQSRSSLLQKNIEIEDAKSALSSYFTELEKNAFVKEQFTHYKNLLNSPPDVIQFSTILNELSTLRAPAKGKVLEVLVNQGEQTTLGESIFWMERPQKKGQVETFYGTLDAETKGRLRKGLRVLIEPSNVNPKEYGAIIGKIESIYPYPVSEEELMQSVGNKQIVSFLLKEGDAQTQITIIPIANPKTKSGYKWTSGKGPPYEIPTGTISKIRVIVEEQPPISYLIPLWRVKPL